ncbi:Tat binding protein 1-interacting protein-domain-containing protein [Zychaea mexicana]|uniref:Tat binding protein 1-interacting protein-domain-containing protein n=1 Tax=Zychaea mexicana TaxID=64656 RepID=UPI0022FE0C7E|nr:Tat binding protein 1-interacting protein-domain-containing protein [Zychaea mexicana]KAI9494471.1 Tat binding protein 1-interacting protein-domain-containing protein [Zychaea mexicana]
MVKKKASSTEEDNAVLDYLRKVNRPYSATDVFNNLHGKYQKSNIVKALERLTDQEVVSQKTYGKTNIYSIKQSKEDIPSPEEAENINKQIEALSREMESVQGDNVKLQKNLKDLKAAPTTDKAKTLTTELIESNDKTQARIDSLKSGTTLITDEEKRKIDAEYDKMRKEWRIRRKIFREIFNAITENMPGKPNDFKEELGIEDDPIPYEQDPLQ